MSKFLYYSCRAGISGDMNLAALVDLGVPLEYLTQELNQLPVSGYEILAEKISHEGTKLTVRLLDHDHHHRTFADIKKIIESSELKKSIKNRSIDIFHTLAEAEAQVHETTPDEVHFHEVGAIDSIVDIVGAAVCLDYLNIDSIASTSVELGAGTIRCAHGIMNVPAPATAILAQKFPSTIGGTDHEATTPTGAAFLATVVDEFCNQAMGWLEKSGCGIGHRASEKLPNRLQVYLYDDGEENTDVHTETATMLEANIDDMTAEHLSYLIDKLLESGASDAWLEPIIMKKNRPATKVCALVSEFHIRKVKEAFFKHGTTLGIRQKTIIKTPLKREEKTLETPWGTVRIKIAHLHDGTTRFKPEFDDCRTIADRENIPLSSILQTIEKTYLS